MSNISNLKTNTRINYNLISLMLDDDHDKEKLN